MKKEKFLFWSSTIIIFLFEGVLVALTSHTKLAVDGITQLGYPVYFVNLLGAFKIVGTLVLIIPQVPARVKEWAYAGFGIDFISAALSMYAVHGFGSGMILPILFIGILTVSYMNYNKLKEAKNSA